MYIINENLDLLNILVIDCGIKNSQLRALLKHNVQLTVVSPFYDFYSKVKNKKYDGIFISNGPRSYVTNFCCRTVKKNI